MQTLNIEQIDAVSGGFWGHIITITLAVVAAGAYLGEAMVERDNKLTCKQST